METAPVPEVPAEVVQAPVADVTDAPADAVVDTVVDDFVITESAPAVEAAMAEPIAEAPADKMDALEALSETLDLVTPVPEPAPIAAADMINVTEEIDVMKAAIDEKTALGMLSDDFTAPQQMIPEMQCHTQLPVDPIQLTTMEMEGAMNGHIASEVSIEG